MSSINEQLYLIFDLETCPLDWNTFSESQQEYLIRNAQSEEEILKKKAEMALSPLTSRIVCCGLQLAHTNPDGSYTIRKRAAYVTDDSVPENEKHELVLATGDQCYSCSEKKLIEVFWEIFEKFPNIHLVSFNGRNFDAPFIMLRSALLGVRPSRNLMSGTKFNYQLHTDLIDELTFYNPSTMGATRRFNFDFFTRAFGIKSPKSEGLDGSKVAEYFADGRLAEIAEYCLRDVEATWQLYLVWNEFLNFNKR